MGVWDKPRQVTIEFWDMAPVRLSKKGMVGQQSASRFATEILGSALFQMRTL